MLRLVYRQGGINPPPLSATPLTPGPWQTVAPGFYRCAIPLPDWARSEVVRLIPGLSLLPAEPCGFRFVLAEMDGPARALDAVGAVDISVPDIVNALSIDVAAIIEDDRIDFFELSARPAALSLLLKLPPGIVPADAELLLSVTVTGAHPTESYVQPDIVPALTVPPISQMEQQAGIARQICSPVNVAMVTRYLSRQEIPVAPLVATAYSARRNMYGIWPNAIWAASRYGITGMVTALADWDEVAKLLAAGLPVIATIAYRDGELTGAAVPVTRGHLVTIIGLAGDTVTVNDPAATTATAVRRDYDRHEFERAWFRNKYGVCYVLWQPQSLLW